MKRELLWILDVVFPPSADEKLIRNLHNAVYIEKLHPQELENEITALTSFKDPHIRAAIHLLKFHRQSHALSLLASVLAHYLETLPKTPYILIPIPLSYKRSLERGYNQCELLAKAGTTRIPHISVRTDILKRVRHTEKQSSLGRNERKENLRNAFVLTASGKKVVEQKHIIILDDVTTTGSTLTEAKAACVGTDAASITCIALSH